MYDLCKCGLVYSICIFYFVFYKVKNTYVIPQLSVRSSHRRCFAKKYSQKFRKIHRKTPVPESACNCIKKEALRQVFSCELYKISKNTVFIELFLAFASEALIILYMFSPFSFVFINALISSAYAKISWQISFFTETCLTPSRLIKRLQMTIQDYV